MSGQIRALSELHPKFLPRVEKWLAGVKKQHIDILVVETRRTMDVATAYYAQGRKDPIQVRTLREKAGLSWISLEESKRIITNAYPGHSWHIYGLAVDFVPMVNRKPDWEYNPHDPHDYYDEIMSEAKKQGMTWGGEWRSFKDFPHLEWHPGWDDVGDALNWMQKHNDWQIPLAV